MYSITQPTLYYYEHCPYCIRVLVFAKTMGVSLQKQVLLNDDEQTPVEMVGKKIVPILEKSPNVFMVESLDVIDYLIDKYDTEPLVANADHENQVNAFLKQHRLSIYGLCMPRWIQLPFKEFATTSAIDYFVHKKVQTIGDFSTALANTPSLAKTLTGALDADTELLVNLTANPKSYAAIILFSGLYGVSSVKGFAWTSAASAFMQTMSEIADFPLLTDSAI